MQRSIEIGMALLLLAPLCGFFINGLRFRSHNAWLAGGIATFAALISFVCSIFLTLKITGEAHSVRVEFFRWIQIDAVNIPAAFVVDSISSLMILVITGVGSLIHLFSIGYMSHDERPAKYFAYLNLFLFNMLILVLGDSLPVMFVGWEGVGLCSYLLIGFWFTDKEKAAAGMKAFVTNRIGDAGFLLGIFTLFYQAGGLSFDHINTWVMSMAPEAIWTGPITLACLFLFVGATGKSAQIPLYVWLPDAMAGPTPVSALIHAATMVTAGVYMIIRLNPLFLHAPLALNVIAIVGAFTALIAATVGITQWDIKKVLAYSTVSQLGYMFLACGVGAFGPAMFHLITHAFFKALMFLGSGSVIHAMHEEQDIRKMGGLAKRLPITHMTFVMGWLAIIGMPPWAGFFSKDEILWQAFHSQFGSTWLWMIGFVTAMLTAFYMTRLMALTFWGRTRVSSSVHVHEAPWTMSVPLMILAVLSLCGGWMGIPHIISSVLPGHIPNILENWLHGSLVTWPQVLGLPAHAESASHEASSALEWALMGLSVVGAAVSAAWAYRLYALTPEVPARVASRFPRLHRLISNKYFVDEAYFAAIIGPLVQGAQSLWAYVDVRFIDRMTEVVSNLAQEFGAFSRGLNSGKMQQYALYVGLGLASTLLFLITR